MKFRIALFAFCLLLPALPALADEPVLSGELKTPGTLTPEFLRDSCYKYGAVNTMRLLTAPGSVLWSELLEHIAGGETDWIIHVPLFASGTDAGYATQLAVALAVALPKNPRAVLSLEYAFVSLRNVCSLPFFDPSEEFIRDYASEVLLSMEEVTDPHMRMDKEICLTRLRNALEIVQKRLDSRP